MLHLFRTFRRPWTALVALLTVAALLGASASFCLAPLAQMLTDVPPQVHAGAPTPPTMDGVMASEDCPQSLCARMESGTTPAGEEWALPPVPQPLVLALLLVLLPIVVWRVPASVKPAEDPQLHYYPPILRFRALRI